MKAEPLTRDATTACAELVRRLLTSVPEPGRFVLGIAGAPGAGKSTCAARLVDQATAAGVSAVVVPMDGFHLAQSVLEARGLADVKGAPETFDAYGYLAVLQRVRAADHTVWAPSFDRTLEEPVAGSIAVEPGVRLVVTEGNYLLDAADPWVRTADLLDETWFVQVPDELRRTRLIARHKRFGRSHAEAVEHALGSDERNARRIAATRERADLVITPPVD
nr:nucleoside/nucleotide kinase family protein [Luteipulveratus halotolerans]